MRQLYARLLSPPDYREGKENYIYVIYIISFPSEGNVKTRFFPSKPAQGKERKFMFFSLTFFSGKERKKHVFFPNASQGRKGNFTFFSLPHHRLFRSRHALLIDSERSFHSLPYTLLNPAQLPFHLSRRLQKLL